MLCSGYSPRAAGWAWASPPSPAPLSTWRAIPRDHQPAGSSSFLGFSSFSTLIGGKLGSLSEKLSPTATFPKPSLQVLPSPVLKIAPFSLQTNFHGDPAIWGQKPSPGSKPGPQASLQPEGRLWKANAWSHPRRPPNPQGPLWGHLLGARTALAGRAQGGLPPCYVLSGRLSAPVSSLPAHSPGFSVPLSLAACAAGGRPHPLSHVHVQGVFWALGVLAFRKEATDGTGVVQSGLWDLK